MKYTYIYIYIYMNKINAMYNQPIGYRAYTLTQTRS
jgi:hypothetical protein